MMAGSYAVYQIMFGLYVQIREQILLLGTGNEIYYIKWNNILPAARCSFSLHDISLKIVVMKFHIPT